MDVFRGEIDHAVAGADVDVDARMRAQEVLQARNQPLRAKRRGAAEQDHAAGGDEAGGGAVYLGQRALAGGQVVAAGCVQGQAAGVAFEQRLAQAVFQLAQLLGHRAGGDVKFLGGELDAEPACGGFKEAQGFQRWLGHMSLALLNA